MLEVLLEHAGEVVTRSELVERCWDEMSEPASNVVDVLIGQLRRRLGSSELIEAVRGVGYRLDPEAPAGRQAGGPGGPGTVSPALRRIRVIRWTTTGVFAITTAACLTVLVVLALRIDSSSRLRSLQDGLAEQASVLGEVITYTDGTLDLSRLQQTQDLRIAPVVGVVSADQIAYASPGQSSLPDDAELRRVVRQVTDEPGVTSFLAPRRVGHGAALGRGIGDRGDVGGHRGPRGRPGGWSGARHGGARAAHARADRHRAAAGGPRGAARPRRVRVRDATRGARAGRPGEVPGRGLPRAAHPAGGARGDPRRGEGPREQRRSGRQGSSAGGPALGDHLGVAAASQGERRYDAREPRAVAPRPARRGCGRGERGRRGRRRAGGGRDRRAGGGRREPRSAWPRRSATSWTTRCGTVRRRSRSSSGPARSR